MAKEIELSLLHNSLDFINTSVKHIVASDTSELKYSILHLFSGTMLLLKERIKKEHWSLVFSNPQQAKFEKFISGDFTSINFRETIETLENVCNIKMKNKNFLNQLQKQRNKIEHFEFALNDFAVKALVGKTLNFCIDFIHEYLDVTSFEDEEKELLEEIKDQLPNFSKYVDERIKECNSFFKYYKEAVAHCDSCMNLFVYSHCDGEYQCKYCLVEYHDLEELTVSYIYNELEISDRDVYKYGAEWPQWECFSCGDNTLTYLAQGSGNYVCFACNYNFISEIVSHCTNCSNPYLEKEGSISLCSGCFQNLQEFD